MQILQLAFLLKPVVRFSNETDSGLDIDASEPDRGRGVNQLATADNDTLP